MDQGAKRTTGRQTRGVWPEKHKRCSKKGGHLAEVLQPSKSEGGWWITGSHQVIIPKGVMKKHNECKASGQSLGTCT